jgi:hypothetical protein
MSGLVESSADARSKTIGQNFRCRAWVNFNGEASSDLVRKSKNVTSITDNGTGDYTINLTTALEDANYSLNVSGSGTSGGSYSNRFILFAKSGADYMQAPTTTTARIVHQNASFNFADNEYVCASFFR